MKITYNFTKENNDQMLYKIECFENIFNRIYSIKKSNCDLFIGCRSYFFKTTWLTRTSSMQQTRT